jgi:hypothetical protein
MSLDRCRQARPALVLVALVAVALLVVGCGGSDDGSTSGDATAGPESATAVAKAEEFGSEASGSQAEGAEAALLGYLEARAGEEWDRACSYLAKDLREVYGKITRGEGCAVFVAKTTEGLSPDQRAELPDVDVESVRVEGDSGYVIYTDAAGAQQARPIEEEGDEWKLSSLLTQLAAGNRPR